jgi:hypothetical protein
MTETTKSKSDTVGSRPLRDHDHDVQSHSQTEGNHA